MLALVLGSSDPPAAALASTAGTIITMFDHWNVPTTRWLGLRVQARACAAIGANERESTHRN